MFVVHLAMCVLRETSDLETGHAATLPPRHVDLEILTSRKLHQWLRWTTYCCQSRCPLSPWSKWRPATLAAWDLRLFTLNPKPLTPEGLEVRKSLESRALRGPECWGFLDVQESQSPVQVGFQGLCPSRKTKGLGFSLELPMGSL